MYARILVATDGSTLSKKAVNSAISLAALCGAELIAIKVVPRYPQSYFEGSIPLSVEDVKRVEKQWAEDGQAVVEAVKKTAATKGVAVKALTVKSDLVSDALISAATKVLVPQKVLLHFAHGVAWQLRHDKAALGNLEVGQFGFQFAPMSGFGPDQWRRVWQSPPPRPLRRSPGAARRRWRSRPRRASR
jgi:nucleotide-binding universal stress UspA family protein